MYGIPNMKLPKEIVERRIRLMEAEGVSFLLNTEADPALLKEYDAAFERVAQALLLIETLDGDQFERLFTGEADPETIKAEFDSEMKDIERRNKEEAEEARRIAKEQEEEQRRKMKEELEKLKAAVDEKNDREVVSFDNNDKDPQ